MHQYCTICLICILHNHSQCQLTSPYLCMQQQCLVQVRTAWKVWRTWSDIDGETGLRFDDSYVQHILLPGLINSEKVKLV